jgi:MFS family permease
MSGVASVPRSLFTVAGYVGVAFANMTVSLPLLLLGDGHPASLTGLLVAVGTSSTALGAAIAHPLRQRIGGAPNLLVIAIVLIACGNVVMMSAGTAAGLGAGIGLLGLGTGGFWVASQVMLGALAGAPGSERNFLTHYAVFTSGTMAGSALTGATVAVLEQFGVDHDAAIRGTLALGLVAALCALRAWWPSACPPELHGDHHPADLSNRFVLNGLTVQIPDLLLVAGMTVLVPLTPILLTDAFHVSALVVGFVMAAVAVAKIAGTLLARRLVDRQGISFAILAMTGAGAGLCLALAGAVTVWVFVPAVLAAVLAVNGVWPLVVDAGQARTAEHGRSTLTIAWNVREYVVIASATAGAAALYTAFGRIAPLFVLGALLFVLAAVAATVVLRLPVVIPQSAARAAEPCETCAGR